MLSCDSQEFKNKIITHREEKERRIKALVSRGFSEHQAFNEIREAMHLGPGHYGPNEGQAAPAVAPAPALSPAAQAIIDGDFLGLAKMTAREEKITLTQAMSKVARELPDLYRRSVEMARRDPIRDRVKR